MTAIDYRDKRLRDLRPHEMPLALLWIASRLFLPLAAGYLFLIACCLPLYVAAGTPAWKFVLSFTPAVVLGAGFVVLVRRKPRERSSAA